MTPKVASTRPPRLQLRARSIAIGALAAAGVVISAWVLLRATRVLGWVAAAALLAALINPVVEALTGRGLRRGLAVAAVLVGTVGLVGLLAWASIGDLRDGLERLRDTAPAAAADLEASDSWIGDAAGQFGLRDRVDELLDELPARLAGGTPARAVQAAASRGIALLITTVLTVFLIGHGPRLVRGALRQLPEDRRGRISTRLHRAYRRTWRYTVSVLAKAVVIGSVIYASAWALDLPAPAVLGLVVGAMSVVPKLGVVLGGMAMVLLAGSVQGGGAVALAASTVVLLQVADGFAMARWIEPSSVQVGPAVSLAVLLLATSLYGLGGGAVGLVLAVFAVALAAEHVPPPEAASGGPGPARPLP